MEKPKWLVPSAGRGGLKISDSRFLSRESSDIRVVWVPAEVVELGLATLSSFMDSSVLAVASL